MRIFIVVFCVLTLSLHASPVAPEPKLTGRWLCVEHSNAVYEFSKAADGLIYGLVVQSDKPKYIGQQMLKRLAYDATEGVFRGRGDTPIGELDITLKFLSPEKIEMVGSKFFFKRTFEFIKVK